MSRKYIVGCIAIGIITSAVYCSAYAEQSDGAETAQYAENSEIAAEPPKQFDENEYTPDLPPVNQTENESGGGDTEITDGGNDAGDLNDGDGDGTLPNEGEGGQNPEDQSTGGDQENQGNQEGQEGQDGENDDNNDENDDNNNDGDNDNDDTGNQDNDTDGDENDDDTYDIGWYNDNDTVFEISSEKQLRGLMMLSNGLAADYEEPVSFAGKRIDMAEHISLESAPWIPIGQEDKPFDGVFNGNSYTISMLNVKADSGQYGGLFGFLTGRIENLHIVNADISGGAANGAAAGFAADGSEIVNVTVSGRVYDGDDNGGIVGITYGTVENSVNNADVTASEYAGGIAGVVGDTGVVQGCSSYKTTLESDALTVKSDNGAGGVAGKSSGIIALCDNNANVEAGTAGGGICAEAESGQITQSYSTGSVQSAAGFAGGITGRGNEIDISYCYVLGMPICGDGISGGIAAELTAGSVTRSYSYFEWKRSDNTAPIVYSGADSDISLCFCLKESADDETDTGENDNPDEEQPPVEDDTEESAEADGDTRNEADVTEAEQKDFESGRLSWLLNTANGKETNEKIWGVNGKYPVIADAQNKPVLRVNTVFNAEGGSILPSAEFCTRDSVVTVKLSSEFKYKLVDLWVRYETSKTETDISEKPYSFTMPDEDVTVYAVFEPIKSSSDKPNDGTDDKENRTRYTVTFDACGGLFYRDTDDECDIIEKTVVKGRSVSAPPSPTMEGYVFDGWYCDSDGKTEYDFGDSVTEDMTLYASYISDSEYSVTFDLNGGEGTAPKAQSVRFGELISDPGSVSWPDGSKEFNGWSTVKNKESTLWDFSSDTMPKKDIVLYALWLDKDLDFSGSGTKSVPYEIKSAEDLSLLSEKVSNGETYRGRYFTLEDNAECDKSIGSRTHPFMGIFDGNGKTVTLDIESKNSYSGLFGFVSGAEITDVNVTGTVNGTDYTGAVAGYAENSVITSCKSDAKVTVTGSYAGGIVGYGSADNSENNGEVSGAQYVGGICGKASADMTACVNTGKVSSDSGYAGGIAGDASGYSITSSSNSGNIVCGNRGGGDEDAYAGGIAGLLKNAEDCENSGQIEGAARTGGITGRVTGTASRCVNTGSVTGTVRAGGIAGSAAVNSLISYCRAEEGSVTALKSYAGGICGECENNAVVEYSFCTAETESGGSYCAGISAKGGTVKYSFYYCETNSDCPVAENAEVYASYHLASSSDNDDNFKEPSKSLSAFEEGRVSWLLNTAGGGDFKRSGNSGIWTTVDGIPAYADNGGGTVAVIASNGADGNEVLINGKDMFFCSKNDKAEISYRENEESSLGSIEIRGFWDGSNIIKTLSAEDMSANEITVAADYIAEGHFTQKAEEPEDDDKKEPDGENQDGQNTGDETNSDSSARSRRSASRRASERNEGSSDFGSINAEGNSNGTGNGGMGITNGSSNGSGGKVGGSGGASGNRGSNAVFSSDTASAGGSKTETDLPADKPAPEEFGESNVTSENSRNTGDANVSLTAATERQLADTIETTPDNAENGAGISETAGRSDDISAGSKKQIAKLRTNELVPSAEKKADGKIGILSLAALLAGFFTNIIFDKRKRNTKT